MRKAIHWLWCLGYQEKAGWPDLRQRTLQEAVVAAQQVYLMQEYKFGPKDEADKKDSKS